MFTARPLAGNGLAVVHDADDVVEAAMLAFARETNLSETTFVQAPTEPGADYRNRIWDPEVEMPFAGHPSLGTAVAVARRRGEREARYVQQTPAGLQPIEVELAADGRAARASMLQEPATMGPELDAGPALAAAGLEAAAAHPQLPVQVVSTGLPHVLVPLASAASLALAHPDITAVRRVLAPHSAATLYLAWWEGDTARARAFFPAGRGGEDPATGSAAGPLCAYLDARTGVSGVTISQGEEMGRPSVLECQMEGDRVRVGGDVVAVMDGAVFL